MAYAFLRSVRSRLLMAFLLTAVIPLLLLSILFYAGFKEEIQAIQTDTRKQIWNSLIERTHESVGSAQRLAQTKLLYWRERLEAIASLASSIYLHPENYKRGPLFSGPIGFFFSSMEGKANVGLIYSPSSKNILSLSHFSRFSYVPPILASVYEGGDIQTSGSLKYRAYIIYPGVNHERLAKEGKLYLKMIMTPEPSDAITNFSEGEQSAPRPSLRLRIPVVFQLGQALSVLKKLGYRLSVINSVFPNITLEQLKQSPFFCARCNQEGLGVGVLLVFEAHGFIMPNPNQAWHFELPSMDQL